MNRSTASLRRPGHRIGWAALLMLLLAFSGQAPAEGTWDDCVRVGSAVEYYPSTSVPIPRDIAVGEAFGPWLSATATPGWSCTRRNAYSGIAVKVFVDASARYNFIGLMTVDGETYGYYPAGSRNFDVGYIARWRAVINGVGMEWTPQTYQGGLFKAALDNVVVTKMAGETYTINLETQIRLVKRTNKLGPGTTVLNFDSLATRFVQSVGTQRSAATLAHTRTSQMRDGGVSLGTVGSCTTPDINVVLPSTPTGSFTGVGSIVGETEFVLQFNNCPSGLTSIQYTLAPTTTAINAADGIVALNSASTARGVAIRVSRGDGSPLQLNTGYQVANYETTLPGNYWVGLRAAYRQTEATVVPGSAGTALTMSVLYK